MIADVRPTVPHEGAQELLDDAHLLGWSIFQHGSKGKRTAASYRLVSPINQQITIDIPPVRQWNADKLRGARDKLVRYSDPDKVEALEVRKQRQQEEREAAARKVHEDEEAALRAAQERADATQPKPGPRLGGQRVGSGNLTYAKPLETTSVEPWLVRHGMREGKVLVYPSHAVLQRTWNNGNVDFQCAVCDYDHENPWSVSTHYSRTKDDKHVNRGQRPEPYPVDDYVAFTPKITKRPFTRTPNAKEPEVPATLPVEDSEDAAAILAQVRTLVSTESDEVARLRAYIAELEDEILKVTADKETAESEVQRVRDALSVLGLRQPE